MSIHASRHRLLPCPRGRPALRATSVLTAAALAWTGTACVPISHWKAVPVTQATVEQLGSPSKRVRLVTDSGPVTLAVKGVAFPYIEGEAEPASDSGLVALDLRRARSAWEVKPEAKGAVRFQQLPVNENEASRLAARSVQFVMDEGYSALRVERVEFPYVVGRPVECFAIDADAHGPETTAYTGGGAEAVSCLGWVRIDLRNVRRLEVRENDVAATVAASLGLTAAILVAIGLVALSTKSAWCPFVYVERETGSELVGEGYAGAMYRSLQRDDLLPLPSLGEGSVRLRLSNEARQVQYTDRAELVLVDHPPEIRVLSLSDGRPVLAGPARPPVAARDLAGRVVTKLVAEADEAFWQSDLEEAAKMAEPPPHEGLVATFAAPAAEGQPLLEIVAANSPLLELVFGRYFAAMGSSFAGNQAATNRPAAGPRIAAWREREGVDLTVQVLRNRGWERVAVVPSVGPIIPRRVVVALPAADTRRPIEVRILGGLGFWRIDQLALSVRREAPLRVHRVPPLTARGSQGQDERDALLARDGRYQVLKRPGESLELMFRLPPVPEGSARTSFFFSNGYYNALLPSGSDGSPQTVHALENEPGALSRFGLDLTREYLRRWRESKHLANAR